jgi:hypothetical protein
MIPSPKTTLLVTSDWPGEPARRAAFHVFDVHQVNALSIFLEELHGVLSG